MPEIVLTEEQARVLTDSTGPVTIRRPDGYACGSIDPRDAEIIAESQRRRAAQGGRGSPAAAVRERFAALQVEWDRVGPFDAAYAREFLRRLRDGGGDE